MTNNLNETAPVPPTGIQHPARQQPFLHELVSCVQAPTVALSGPDGQIRPAGAHGVVHNDRRVLSELVVTIDGLEPIPAGHSLAEGGRARFTGIVRHLGDPGADPTVRLERERRATADGLDEQIELVNASRLPITAVVQVRLAADLAAIVSVKAGLTAAPVAPSELDSGNLVWLDDQSRITVRSTPAGAAVEKDPDGRCLLEWRPTVAAGARWVAGVALDVAGGTRPNTFLPAKAGPGWDSPAVTGPVDLVRLVERGVDDLTALTLTDPLAPGDVFVAAGSPWFFTLFGRDSLWTARMTVPLGTDLARGTLRTLARRQGTRYDDETTEAPGKILHEIRALPTDAADHGLPPVYFGTVDATALWVCLLHDAWRWGMATLDVRALLDPLEAALGWILTDADSDGDGFSEYIDTSGRGLANQGWKDSGDSIQFPDGTVAEPPIALSEAQAYAYQAAIRGAELLTAFDRPGADRLLDWAAELRERFRAAFWVGDDRGRFPAVALDGAKTPVGTATSNLGHLLGTGLLDPAETATVAHRLSQPDLDCGYGLRTMSADAAGFNPLGYHTGTVWPHDTAIAVLGLARDGHAPAAASLAAGLLRAAPDFDHRLPELFAGTDARAGEAVLAYPASCRPQAWAAAAPLALLQAALGLEADVPRGELRVAPRPDFAWMFPLRITGLRVAGHPLTIDVDAAGKPRVQTTAPLTITE